MRLALRKHQWDKVRWLVTKPRCAIWAGMGSGKTASVLMAVSFLQLIKESPVLVIAPLRVALTTWVNETGQWHDFRHLKIIPINGTPEQRRAALRQRANIHTVNYENIPWLVEECGVNWPFTIVVADESTHLKSFRMNRGSRRAASLTNVPWDKVEHFIELTGTPSPNGLVDLWGQIWFLDRGERLGRTFTVFIDRWFRTLKTGAHSGAVRYVPRKQTVDKMEDFLKIYACLSTLPITLILKNLFIILFL